MAADYIVHGVFLIAYLIVFILQFNQIKHLKNKLETLEKFQKIFDVKKFKEYSEWLEKDFERKLTQAQIQRLDDTYLAYMVEEMKKIPEQTLHRYIELFAFVLHFLEQTEKHDQEIFLSKFPANEEILRKNLLKIKGKT